MNKALRKLTASVSSVTMNKTLKGERVIYTFFYDGLIVELATCWFHFISREPRYSVHTIYQYAVNFCDLLNWFIEEHKYQKLSLDLALKLATRIDLQKWLADRKAEGIKASTLRNREATVKNFFEWQATEASGNIRSLESSPYKTGKLISPPPERRNPSYLNAETLIQMLGGYHNESERCYSHCLYDTGVRVSELARILKRDLPDANAFPQGAKYFPLNVRGSKGRGGQIKERIALISSPVLARIKRYHNTPEYRYSPYFDHNDLNKPVFLGVNGYPLSSRNVRSQMRLAATRTGLAPSETSPHKWRHGAAFAILKSELGADYFDKLVLLKKLFGHKRLTTTEIYTAIPPAVLAKLNNDSVVTDKYSEAKMIKDATYLSPLMHKERRGHRIRQR
jgi:site-specific recombinase XerD